MSRTRPSHLSPFLSTWSLPKEASLSKRSGIIILFSGVEGKERGFVVQGGRRRVYKSTIEAFGRLRIVLTTGLKSPVGEKL
ncbi:hypothetical protein BDL97_07G122400 [Sphagnum fallax]|nr:hypothetical protein BDL97_07G122400 [Sphagnum fallax]